MRSRIDFIADRIEINLAESGTQIALAWNIWPDGAVRDPVTGQFPGTPTPGQAGVPALLHFVSASSTVRQFAEIQTGDCMVDLSPKLDLKGKDGLTFWLPSGADGTMEQWSNKPISQELAVFWDTIQCGRKLWQTVLLRKAT